MRTAQTAFRGSERASCVGEQSVRHILHTTTAQSMEVFRLFTEGYKLHSSDHEPVDMGRDALGVSFLASASSSPAYHLPLVR